MIEIIGDKIQIKQATKQGYIEIDLAERESKWIADLSYPTSKTRRGRIENNGQISPTITTTGGLYVLEEIIRNKIKIRKMTPKEAFLCMGLEEDDWKKCKDIGISDSQLFKIAGNGLVPQCVQYIMEHAYKALEDEAYETTDERMVRLGYGVK